MATEANTQAAGDDGAEIWRGLVYVRPGLLDGISVTAVLDHTGAIIFHNENRSAVWFWIAQNDLTALVLH